MAARTALLAVVRTALPAAVARTETALPGVARTVTALPGVARTAVAQAVAPVAGHSSFTLRSVRTERAAKSQRRPAQPPAGHNERRVGARPAAVGARRQTEASRPTPQRAGMPRPRRARRPARARQP